MLTFEVYTGGLVYSTDKTLETLLRAVVTGHRLIYNDKLEVSCYFQTHWWIEACTPQCCHVRVELKQIEKDADSRLMFQVSFLSSKTHRISPLALLPFDYHFTQPAAPTFRWEMYLEEEDTQPTSFSLSPSPFILQIWILMYLNLTKNRKAI